MKADIRIEGLDHIERVLREKLPPKAQRKVMTQGLRRAPAPIRDTARRNARGGAQSSGALAMSIGVWGVRKGLLARRGTFASVEVGPRRSNKRALARYYAFHGRKPTPRQLQLGIRHGHLVEFGFTHRSGRRVAGRSFLWRALQTKADEAIRTFRDVMVGLIEKEAAKQGRLQKR